MAVMLDLRDDFQGYVDILYSLFLKLYVLLVVIFDINMMQVIDLHVLVLQLLMTNKLNI
jgi:hypothetical protein